MHRPAPEFSEQLALNLDVLNVPGVFGWLDRRNDLVESNFDRPIMARINCEFDWRAVEISRRAAPLLAFATIHGELHHVPVFTFESFVNVQERLHPILARLQLRNRFEGITERAGVNRRGLAGL